MRLAVACCWVSMAGALAGCAASPGPDPTDLTLTVGGGAGSQHGNYAGQRDGETLGPSGERCLAFNWDRPLGNGRVLRVRSASCPSREIPGRMVGRELSRTIIPLSQSTLKDGDGGQ